MHGCMTEYVVCNHPRADGRIAVHVCDLEPYQVSISLGQCVRLEEGIY